ncbi:hypothetical protein AXI70_gp28 [Cronobacter phage Dev-CD-23823]|uniref:Uncharacterized protein n=1 Tax=Cronobacter phage Dev-CD-23823 TaxID=1712539 RepID=A0A0K8IWL3_9CAUD|nr:hypothetical protein AXI70_gp28 [Cronobacter phage Dev-CD-23823]CUH74603.1 hypothetical protein [Cronobacter phage Dev-CD-23823]
MRPSEWCLNKLDKALADYDIKAAKDYLDMAKLWLSRGQ